MKRPIKSIMGFKIKAEDGEIGHVVDFFFDDEHLVIRYLVCDIGSWLPDKRVLISPAGFLGTPEWEQRLFPVIFTKEMVRKRPDVDTDKPVSRQKEEELAVYYNWPLYWQSGIPSTIPGIVPALPSGVFRKPGEKRESHLRSVKEVSGYACAAQDGEIGHITDFIIDDEIWNICYLVVDTGNWLPGKKVLIAPQWIGKVSWEEASVHVELPRETVKHSPVYDPQGLISQEYEMKLHEHYEHMRRK